VFLFALKLNGKCQLLVYADDTNILGGSTCTIKKHRLSKFFYSPTDAQVNCLKKNFKINIKINIKTIPACFGAVTPSSGSAILMLAKVTVVKIAN
jgi:hypothetical protein